MSKEVKRYGMCGFESGIVEMEDGPFVAWDDYEALLAERDVLKKDAERLDWLDGYVVSAESEDAGKIAFSSIRGALRECVDAAIDAALQGAQP